MSYSNPVPLPPEEDLDRLLARELPKLLPEPFPAFQYPARVKSAARGWETSRLTLALSVAALLGLGLALSPHHPAGQRQNAHNATVTSSLLDQSTADGQELLKRLKLETPTPPME